MRWRVRVSAKFDWLTKVCGESGGSPRMVGAAGREDLRQIVKDAQAVGPVFAGEAGEDLGRGVGALVMDRDDLVEVLDVRADRRLDELGAILDAHERAYAGQPGADTQVVGTEAISLYDLGSMRTQVGRERHRGRPQRYLTPTTS
jgi:hypothetical protein